MFQLMTEGIFLHWSCSSYSVLILIPHLLFFFPSVLFYLPLSSSLSPLLPTFSLSQTHSGTHSPCCIAVSSHSFLGRHVSSYCVQLVLSLLITLFYLQSGLQVYFAYKQSLHVSAPPVLILPLGLIVFEAVSLWTHWHLIVYAYEMLFLKFDFVFHFTVWPRLISVSCLCLLNPGIQGVYHISVSHSLFLFSLPLPSFPSFLPFLLPPSLTSKPSLSFIHSVCLLKEGLM